MNPTGKQLTTFDAVLTCISAAGYDPNVAQAAAEADVAAGVPVLTAYSRALNGYVSTLPTETRGQSRRLQSWWLPATTPPSPSMMPRSAHIMPATATTNQPLKHCFP